jgi:putative phosphoribosyl transferase
MRFSDRDDAGRRLAAVLESVRAERPVVVALTRGGVPVGARVAVALAAPLAALSPRKVGHPLQPEYAIAAVTEDGPVVEGEEDLQRFDAAWLEAAVAGERREARRRREAYGGPPLASLVAGRTAILVDDGLATGLTMRAALAAVVAAGAARTVVAVPVAPTSTVERLRGEADEVVVAHLPRHFQGAIGSYYQRFGQVSDDEVLHLLEEAQRAERERASSATSSS